MSRESRPPRLAEGLLAAVIGGDARGEGVLGDLHEEFLRDMETAPIRAALWYWINSLRLSARFTAQSATAKVRDVADRVRGQRQEHEALSSTARRSHDADDRHGGSVCVPRAVRAARSHGAHRAEPRSGARGERDDFHTDRRPRRSSVSISGRRPRGPRGGNVAHHGLQAGVGVGRELPGLEIAGRLAPEPRRDAVVGRQRHRTRRTRERSGLPSFTRLLSSARCPACTRARIPAGRGSAGPASPCRPGPGRVAASIWRRSRHPRSNDHS